MAVSKTETRLPFDFQATDLGEAKESPDGKFFVIAYYETPLAKNRQQTYVAIITNVALQNSTTKFQWQVNNQDQTTTEGVWQHTPNDEGLLSLNVTLLDGANLALSSLTLEQTVIPLNQDLETLISLDNASHPVAGDPATSREIINDMLVHIHNIAPVHTEQLLNKLLYGIAYTEALSHPKSDRELLINTLRSNINNAQLSQFFQNAERGAGICNIRPLILAMTIVRTGSSLIPWQTFPTEATARQTTLTQVQSALAALTENDAIDMFNLFRFPKANLQACKKIFDQLRTKQFSGNTYDVVMGNSTNAQQLIEHFKSGPNVAATP